MSATIPFSASDSNAGFISGNIVRPVAVSPLEPRMLTLTRKYEYRVSCARPS